MSMRIRDRLGLSEVGSETETFAKDAPLPAPRELTQGIRKRERDRAERSGRPRF